MTEELKLKELLGAGVHFGHQTYRWNPKMKKYVFGERNGIYIIDLAKTIPLAKKAYDFLKRVTADGKQILFVGTKRQASDVVKECAVDCGAFYVTNRWLGGMLTNYQTVTLSVDKLRKVEKMKESGDFNLLTKKERLKIEKNVLKLEKYLGGVKDMRKLPGAVFIVDPNNERIALKEANKLGIPVIAITDTNCNPEGIDYVIPANDDATKSISILTEYFAKSVKEGAQKVKKTPSAQKAKVDADLEKEMQIRLEKSQI